MMGNVQEWTADELKPYKGNDRQQRDISRASLHGARRFLRDVPEQGRGDVPVHPSAYFPKAQYGLGFRCVKDVAPKTTSNHGREVLALLLPDLTTC